jgi:LacI family transcriptional regulator
VFRVSPAARDRLRGYRDCLKKNNIPRDDILTESAESWQPAAGAGAMRRILERRADITAVFACSDHLAFGALKALNGAGRKVPEDISVVGFDGDLYGEYINPALTTMQQNCALIGQTAGELLLQKLAGDEIPDTVRIPADLLIRGSTRKNKHR